MHHVTLFSQADQHMNSPARKSPRTRDEKEELFIIQQTDVDAKVAKRSAVQLRYLTDPYIQEFVKPFVRKSPIINRGSPYSFLPSHPFADLA